MCQCVQLLHMIDTDYSLYSTCNYISFRFKSMILGIYRPLFHYISRPTPCSRPCSLEEQYFKCGIFWDYDAPQRRVSNSEAPVLAGGIHVFLRGSQFSGASELKEGPVSTNWHKFLNVKSARRSWLPPRSLGTNAQCMERKGENNIFAKYAISLCKHKQD